MALLLGLVAVLAMPDSAGRVIAPRFAAAAPKIDGILEDVWQSADSAGDFTQFTPDHGRPASEATTVYLLCDRQYVYVAFRCRVKDPKTLCARLTGVNDGIRLFFDTFDDNASCYAFAVSAGGVEQSYRLTMDGNWVEQWSGIWWSRVRVEPWGFAVELAIPFKTLRYPAGRSHWGVEFGRYVAGRGEKSYWCEHEPTLVKVSRFGRLEGINVRSAGLHLEAYPVGLLRYERDAADRVVPTAGLDAAWLPTPTANIQLTTFPDYAEIEADPFRVNLSKYELWLAERRPFFVEAAENFGSGFPSIRLFYSRRIGKRLDDGTEVPILSGLKYTDRVGRFQLGALGALAGRTGWNSGADTEPAAVYSVLSLRRQVLENSELGLLYAGKDATVPGFADPLNHYLPASGNHGLRLDGTFRRGSLTASLYAAGSQLDECRDYALALSSSYEGSGMNAYFEALSVRPGFDMNGIGYTGWRGQSVYAGAGPSVYSRGPFQNASLTLHGSMAREWAYPEGSRDRQVGFSSWGTFRNQVCLSLWSSLSHSSYQDTAGVYQPYDGANFGGMGYTDESRMLYLYLYGDYTTRTFNYNRMWLAPTASAQAELTARLGDRLSLMLGAELIAEFQPDGKLDVERDLTRIVRPHASYAFTPKMSVNLGSEMVRGCDLERDRADYSYYFTALYAWTLRPRSTFYLAVNQRLAGGTGWVEPAGTLAAVKLRYLIVF